MVDINWEKLAPLDQELFAAAASGDVDEIRKSVLRGADVSAKEEYGWTPLLVTIDRGYMDACEALIEMGANVNAALNAGQTVLHWAALHWPGKVENEDAGLPMCVKLIAAGANVHAKNCFGTAPIEFAVVQKALPLAEADILAKLLDGARVSKNAPISI